jgi:hypothetical protein
MEFKIAKSAAEYRLVYFQPEPETGERLCIGLLFMNEQGKRTLLYDRDFSRVRCFAPDFEVALLRFIMANLEEQLRNKYLTSDQLQFGLGSQIAFSAQRVVSSPISDSAKLHLMERFVLHKESEAPISTIQAESNRTATEARLRQHLLNFARPLAREGRELIEHPGPRQILGRPIPGVSKVSLAISYDGKMTILDGVDLSIQSPKEVVTRTGKVAHTFWQYRRYSGDSVFQGRPNRVAFIFNGASNPEPLYRDAQAFAREIFENESDLLIEHDSTDELERLRQLA